MKEDEEEEREEGQGEEEEEEEEEDEEEGRRDLIRTHGLRRKLRRAPKTIPRELKRPT